MTLARRVAALEASLTPTQLVLRWLDQAHAHSSIDAYVSAILADDPADPPLDRLCREASAGARAAAHGRVRDQFDTAVGKALRETVFRFELVMRINVMAHELLEKEQLLHALFAAHLAMLGSEGPESRRDESHHRRLTLMRGLVLGRVAELEAVAEARTLAEERYLDGLPALFPDAIKAWDAQLRATRELAALAIRLGELDEVVLPESEHQDARNADAVSARAAALVADLVEPAKSTALEKLGEGERAMRVATRWLQAKVAASNSSAATID